MNTEEREQKNAEWRKNNLSKNIDLAKVIASTDDNIWIKKFRKSKAGKIMDLVYDVKIMKAEYKHYTKLSFLAEALMISARGTKQEEDAVNLIKEIYPEYFTVE